MLDRIHWLAVLIGTTTTILVAVSLTIFVGVVVDPFLYDLFAEKNSEEGVAFTGRGWSAYTNLSLFLHLLAVLLGFFAGGAMAGRVAPAFPGLNSAGTALGAIGVGVVWMIITLVPVALTTFSGLSDPYIRGENLGLLVAWVFAFCVAAPLSLLASYLGSRLGRRMSSAARPGA